MKIFLLTIICCIFAILSVEAGEIEGAVSLTTEKVPARAKNRNPDRKTSLKKYGTKDLAKAQAGGQGGVPPNEVVDERDYAVVFLTAAGDGAKLKATASTVEVRQKGRQFRNHVTPLTLGSKVRFTNEDQFFHHIYCPDSAKMNAPEHRGNVERKPDKLGKLELFCDIHPLMNAYVYVVPNDYYSLVKGGAFRLKAVPPGNYSMSVWHPRLASKSYQVKVTESGVSKVDISL